MPDSSNEAKLDGRLIVVSNRLPVSVIHEGEGWGTKRSAGGLATAMDPILKKNNGLWIGWSGSEKPLPEEALAQLRSEQGCVTVDLPPDLLSKFYDGYSNQALWPLFHSFTSRLDFESAEWEGYNEANRLFCDAVVKEYQPGDRIWVHDYQLLLLPGLLREKLPDAAIGFFLHIPFPGSDIFAILPRGDELLRGMLGADLIGFHTHLHLQHFRMSLRRLLGIESAVDHVQADGRCVKLGALPIGIAPPDYSSLLNSPETNECTAALERQYSGRKLIVAVDRLDYTKGIPHRLHAFRALLETKPEWRGKVVLLQVAVPSRENIGSYQELRKLIHELISEINGQYGTPDWVPVIYIHRSIPRPELVAIYAHADVAWVSPLRDGMNLVAKEYVACQEQGNGVLVLSSFAGAAEAMAEAILVNPFDQERSVCAVVRALNMDEAERRERMAALHQRVLRTDVFQWADRFLELLNEAAGGRRQRNLEARRQLPFGDVVDAYRRAPRRLIFLDYDGTLVTFATRPQEAAPTPDLTQLLTRLAADDRNSVVVISGRKAVDLQQWLGRICKLGLAPEHGSRWRLPGSDVWEGQTTDGKWKESVRPILEHFVDRTPGSFIEEKEFALVWHFRNMEAEFGDWLANELVSMLDGLLAETDLRAYQGKKIVEVKPLWANKGTLARSLVPDYGPDDFIMGIGDDRTDEDLFAALPEGSWRIHVGSGPTSAPYDLPNSRAVRNLLGRLVESAAGASSQ